MAEALTLLERLEHRIARGLVHRLSPRLQVLLSGGRPVTHEGLTLHPELQLLLALRERRGSKPVSTYSPAEARRRLRREALQHAGEPNPVGRVQELRIDTPAGGLRARHYAPEDPGSAPRPLLLFLHGGGFVLGDLDTHDPACRLLCRHADVHVLAVEYRLAPEAPYPAALEDALATFAWACAQAQALGADPARIAVGGDSAGGNLAAVVSQVTARSGGHVPVAQLLLYPVLDRSTERPSLGHFAEGFFLTRDEVAWYQEHYTGGRSCEDPRISPLCAHDLSGLPPALVVTAGFDPLRDEGEAYAHALQEAGTPTRLRRFDGLVHGFANMGGLSPACRAAVVEVAELFKELLQAREGQR